MTKLAVVLVALLMVMGTGCQRGRSPEDDPFFLPTPTRSSESAAPTPVGTPEPRGPYVLEGLPLCQGIKELPSPLKFTWPNIETALEKLADYEWGYYSCALPQAALVTFYRNTMPKPPYLWEQVNDVTHTEGTLGLYYHPVRRTWLYIWMLPQTDKGSSYLVIAHGPPGESQSWECWVPVPPVARRNMGPS